MREAIEIRGASVNNRKRLNVDIPKEQLVLLAGAPGSGKSRKLFMLSYSKPLPLYPIGHTFVPPILRLV